jgi:hypothetical protein
MTEFPALHEALVTAGLRRRRRRRTVGAAVPALALAAAAIALFALAGNSPPERERVAQPPRDELDAAFAVFRRPQTAADRLPVRDPSVGTVDEARTRLVARGGHARVFAYPATTPKGERRLCLTLVLGGTWSNGCTRLASAVRETAPLGVSATGTWAQIFPDGTRDVVVTLADGIRVPAKLQDNAILVTRPQDVEKASWTAGSGTRHIIEIGFPAARPVLPETCPAALAPLPKDATADAERVALIAVDRLYPGVAEASVTGTAHPLGTPCPGLASRTLEVRLKLVPRGRKQRKSASLTQGRLLVGKVDGHLQVYYLLH